MQINNKFLSAVGVIAAEDNKMNDIIVTAKANVTIRDIPSTVEVINREDIEKSGARSVAEVLKSVAGFSWTINSSSTYGRQNIGIRGMDSNHILILIDGERVSETDSFIGHSNYKLSFIDINAVERIEIIKGSGSVIYGSEAMGGVINIITKAGDKKSYNRLTVGVSKVKNRDGGNGQNLALTSVMAGDKARIQANLNYDSIGVIKDGTTLKFEERKNKNIAFRVDYDLDKDSKIGVNLFSGKEKRNKISTTYYDIDRKKYSVYYQTKFNNLTTKFKLYNNKTDAGYHAFNSCPYYTHKIEDRIISAEIFGKIKNNQYLTTGIEQHKQDYFKDYSDSTKTDYRSKGSIQKSIYVQDKISINSGTITAGIRFDDNSQFGNGTNPAIGYVHNLASGARLKFNYSKAFKAPNIKEADSNYSYSHGFPRAGGFIGNSKLRPETSTNTEIALTGSGDGFDYQLAIFRTKIKDMITSKKTGQVFAPTRGAEYQYVNVNKATIKGIEISANFDLSDSLFLETDYTL